VYASLGIEPPVIYTQFDHPVYSVVLVLPGWYEKGNGNIILFGTFSLLLPLIS